MGNKSLFPGRVSEANQGRGQPRRGYRRPKPATHSGAGRKSRRAAGFLWYFLSLRKKVLPPAGRQPHRPRRSRRVIPSLEKGGLRLQKHQRAFLSPLWKPSDTEAAEKPIGGKIPIRAAAGPSSHRQPKTARQENPLSRRAATIFPKINPLLHPPLRRTQCASDTPDRKSRWAGLPASAWPSSRPYPPSRSRLSGTARQWGWSCTS